MNVLGKLTMYVSNEYATVFLLRSCHLVCHVIQLYSLNFIFQRVSTVYTVFIIITV